MSLLLVKGQREKQIQRKNKHRKKRSWQEIKKHRTEKEDPLFQKERDTVDLQKKVSQRLITKMLTYSKILSLKQAKLFQAE